MREKLERDSEKAIVSGVLSGLAQYFNQDPVLFRVLAIAFLIVTGFFPGIFIYIAAWLVMPKKGEKKAGKRVDYEM
jgi:phage shock protein PspC (stress-responsive transcriptional regulator)